MVNNGDTPTINQKKLISEKKTTLNHSEVLTSTINHWFIELNNIEYWLITIEPVSILNNWTIEYIYYEPLTITIHLKGSLKWFLTFSWLVVGPPLWKIWKSIGMIRNPILMGK